MDELISKNYSTGDISDALSKLGIESYIPDIVIKSPIQNCQNIKVVGFAHTIEMVLTNNTSAPKPMLITDKNHIDIAPPGSVIVIKSPKNAPNAVFGGLLGTRAKKIGVKGVVIEGRLRDLKELWDMEFPAFATGNSTMGAAPFSRVSTVGEPITLAADTIAPVVVKEGDIIVGDIDGVVRIPKDKLDKVLKILQFLTLQDEKVLQHILKGETLKNSFEKFRKPLPTELL
ncbi:hypothetical protein HDU92_007562 [Lobulomyces angularis]|nr:hypothetical protein HDU92_007562 [Lobulomyces angularis]